MKPISFAVLLCAAFTIFPLMSSASPVTMPTDLNPGDTYRLAFVTSTQLDATSSNIDDYNSVVSTVASAVTELASLGTTWSAIGSTAAVDARDNTSTNPSVSTGVPIYLLDGVRIANNNADLWDSNIASPLAILESGVPPPLPVNVWTGTHFDGTASPSTYLGAPSNALFGVTFLSTQGWIHGLSTTKFNLHSLYGISGVLTIPEVPEPCTLFLLAGSLGAFGAMTRFPGKRRRIWQP